GAGEDGFRDAARALHAAVYDAAFLLRRPQAHHGLPGQVHEGVAAGDVRHCIHREGAHFAAGDLALRGTRECNDLVTALQRTIDEPLPDEPGGAGDADVHDLQVRRGTPLGWGLLELRFQPAVRELVPGAIRGPARRIDRAVGLHD